MLFKHRVAFHRDLESFAVFKRILSTQFTFFTHKPAMKSVKTNNIGCIDVGFAC